VKIYGSDLKEIERIGLKSRQLLKQVPGATDIVADRIVGQAVPRIRDRSRPHRAYGVNIRDVQDVIEIAIGGMNIMESVEGRERYPIRVRYLREFREDIPELEKVSRTTVPAARRCRSRKSSRSRACSARRKSKASAPARRLRHHEHARPRRSERGRRRRTPAASRAARRPLKCPPATIGNGAANSRTSARDTTRMQILVPVCLFIMFVMLYLGFEALVDRAHHLLRHPRSAAGGFIMLGCGGRNLSVAVWVGSSCCSASSMTMAS
jgi:Cu(I)/Ag(I) efflux system membrane protein CusA/SilA